MNKKCLLVLSSLGVSFSIIFIVFFLVAKLNEPIQVYKIEMQTNSKIPVQFQIPILGIDTSIESVGMTRQGEMDAPRGPKTVGWFSLGPVPGEIGSAVIDGHSGYKNNKPAVFDDLYKIKLGDKILVTNLDGTINTFIVKEVKEYDKDEEASSVFIATDGKAHLNLITCSGEWNVLEKTHSKRLIVYSDLE